ncbi:MAG: HDIG domain-containing protein [Chlorobi bacterium]|nr:HDIG domain-containing protein [Chlorobiota bacterium]
MKQFFRKIGDIIGKTYRTLLFILTAIIIVYFFPTEGKFRYEFQKGKPWMHADLIAPFDFAIRKTEPEIKAEKDSILKQYKPYFKIDDQVSINQLNQLNLDFSDKWANYIKSNARNKGKENIKIANADYRKNINFLFAKNLLEFIYKKGVIELPDELKLDEKQNPIIVKINNNVANEVELSGVFSQKTAYQYILQKIDESRYDITGGDKLDYGFLKAMKIDNYIYPNLFYYEETSLKAQQRLLENISTTRGMIQKGERIISKGDVVNYEKFRILTSLKQEFETTLGTTANYYWILTGQLLFVAVSILVLFLFLYNFRREILQDSLKTTFIIVLFLITILAAILGLKINTLSLYLIPFAILPIIIRTFYDARLALFIHMVAILIIGFLAPNGFEFVFIQFITGIVAIFTLINIHRRGQLFLAAGLVFLSYVAVYFGMAIMHEGDIYKIEYTKFALFAGNSLLLLSSYPMIWLFEKLFGFLSDVTLMELSDTNQPLLRELAEKAPGTFQHCMQVAGLAEEATRKIGGNPMLIRTGALYHDIGKMHNPEYFIENQGHGKNPHDAIEFDESAKIIIGHVEKGIEKAKRKNLPAPIIDFIRTHHGTTKVQFFYRSFINKFPEKDVDIEKFTYPGPTPFSKETAVLMMADSVEAASRSLKELTEENLDNLVDKIIEYQIRENQMAEADLTFKDVSDVKRIFKAKLKNIYHARIEYPEEKVKEEN